MSEQREIRFDSQLLDHIRWHRNVEVKSMLNEQLVHAFDGWGTLLHHAALWDNAVIARELIELGAEVDRLGGAGHTPLMKAVQEENRDTVNVLLEANANIYVANDDGRNALQMALELDHFHSHLYDGKYLFVHDIVKAFVCRVRTEARTTKELAEKLIAAGCNMHHAAIFEDIKLMKCMLDHGIDINSKGLNKRTALHTAADLDNESLARWLIDHGADVNAHDENEKSALLISALYVNKDIVTMLLEQGADPNSKDILLDNTPLFAVIKNPRNIFLESVECVELLLQYGATPWNSNFDMRTMFDYALRRSSETIIKMLIGHLAVLEMRGMSITKSVMYCKEVNHQSKQPEFENFHARCLQILKIKVFEELSFFDLLAMSGRKMRFHARDATFMFMVGDFFLKHDLTNIFPLHFQLLISSIAKARELIDQEDKAIPVICKVFDGNYNQCYIFARKVVGYLNEQDLQQLTKVWPLRF